MSFGKWENWEEGIGYELRALPKLRPYLWVFRKPWWEFTANRERPITYEDPKGQLWRPALTFNTDLGTTPRLTQILFPSERYPGPFLFHDSATGVEGKIGPSSDWQEISGLWFAPRRGVGWVWRELPRKEADNLLYDMVGAWPDGGCWFDRAVIWGAVSAWGMVRPPTR